MATPSEGTDGSGHASSAIFGLSSPFATVSVNSDPPRAPLDGARHTFRDFDRKEVYDEAANAAFAASASNFVVEFGNNTARVACNLNESQVKELLNEPLSGATPVRWINIWNPSTQRGIVEAIGSRYHFSKRLTMSIWAWDEVRKKLGDSEQVVRKDKVQHPKLHRWRVLLPRTTAHLPQPAQSTTYVDNGSLEAAIASARASGEDNEEKNTASAAAKPESGGIQSGKSFHHTLDAQTLGVFRVMQSNLNYNTVDQEKSCMFSFTLQLMGMSR